MKENEISIVINRSVSEVFEFTTNPKNTPKWIENITREETNEFPIGLGTKYRNVNRQGKWTEYAMVAFNKGKMFEMKQKDSLYHVRYTFEPISNAKTKLTYYEWVEDGELEDLFTLDILKKLKEAMEA